MSASLLIFSGLLPALCAAESERRQVRPSVPFWLGLADNQQIDARVAHLLSRDAVAVVLRADRYGSSSSDFPDLVEGVRGVAPEVPVFVYSWVSRYKNDRRIGSDDMDWLTSQADMQVRAPSGGRLSTFGDVTNPDYRNRVVKVITGMVEETGADGVAIDLAVRTPEFRPMPLARLCAQDSELCQRYAEGMEAVFGQLREVLGDGPIVFNGLWTFGPDMVADQARLLRHSDAAIVEYFGINPRKSSHGFESDILPYLRFMQEMPDGKSLFVYGRVPWRYLDHEEDYRWQRYLYAAYLLASNENTRFKHPATFQVARTVGRTGGLDVYADLRVQLGAPNGAYEVADGLYSRSFEHGLVAVAPDSGKGGRVALGRNMSTPEVESVRGEVDLAPGVGLILLDSEPPTRPTGSRVDLRSLGGWSAARWLEQSEAFGHLSLATLTDVALGEHDLLLTNERYLHPEPYLRLKLRLATESSRVLLVADIDDPDRRVDTSVLVLRAGADLTIDAERRRPRFRAGVYRQGRVPYIAGPEVEVGEWQALRLDGEALDMGPYDFRGWRYACFMGPADVAEIGLGCLLQ